MSKIPVLIMISLLVLAATAQAELRLDGFLQGLYGGRLDENNPTATEMTASETRFQLRAEHLGENAEFFARLDFIHDMADTVKNDWELREGFLKFRLGRAFDFKIGRQILTWGTGDLIFINDVFAKDYRSFFVGRDDQYLKAPQDAIRMAVYPGFGELSLVWTPRFEPNRLPTGRNLSYYHPFLGRIVGDESYFDPTRPEAKFENGELAVQFSRQVGNFNTALYFYRGFYKNPAGAIMTNNGPVPVFPHLNVYGVSTRGSLIGGILWLEGGYFDSRDDQGGNKPFMPNSQVFGLLGFERQIAANLTANLQWQADAITNYDDYEAGQVAMGGYVRDEWRHLLTTRVTKLLNAELVKLSGFVFYSPTDEDVYARGSLEYKYTDEVTIALGGNFFEGKHPATEFGQFQCNDNVYLKVTYGF